MWRVDAPWEAKYAAVFRPYVEFVRSIALVVEEFVKLFCKIRD